MRLRALLSVCLMALALAISACGNGDGATQIAVTGTDFSFDPRQITVQSGQEVELALMNRGATTHNLHIPDLNVATRDIAPGQSDTVRFTPETPGTFEFLCTIPGHAEAGMVGELIVR